jgi:hypothetical protein
MPESCTEDSSHNGERVVFHLVTGISDRLLSRKAYASCCFTITDHREDSHLCLISNSAEIQCSAFTNYIHSLMSLGKQSGSRFRELEYPLMVV